jgi:hypothetical protein
MSYYVRYLKHHLSNYLKYDAISKLPSEAKVASVMPIICEPVLLDVVKQ